MSNTVQHKRSTTSGTSPSASDLAVGEIGINTADRTLFTKHSDGTVVSVADVASDTTPQLSGDLDTNSHNILVDYQHYIQWGNPSNESSPDLKIMSNSYGAGLFSSNLSFNIGTQATNGYVSINNQSFSPAFSESARFNIGGSANLYHANVKRLETTSSGIQTTGTVNVNGAYTLPTSDGSANQVLQTDGNGALSFATVSGGSGSGISNVVEDTTPELGGQLDLNGNSITQSTGAVTIENQDNNKNVNLSVGQGHTVFSVTGSGVELDSANRTAKFGGDGSTGGVTLANGYVDIKGKSVSEATYINFYCESSNAHAVKLQAPAHADFSGNITSTLPNTTGTLVTSNAQRRIEVVSSLPGSPDSNTIYFVT